MAPGEHVIADHSHSPFARLRREGLKQSGATLASGDQRVADIRASYEQQIDQIRKGRDAATSAAPTMRRRADQAEARLDTQSTPRPRTTPKKSTP